jgi:DNA-directed RNA polymerase subunit RPC12/RpoP
MVFYICEKCGKEFNRKSNYMYHIENVKNCDKIKENQNFKCNYCNTLFTLKNNLKRHEKFCKEKIKYENETISINKGEFNKMMEIINSNKLTNEIKGDVNVSNIKKQINTHNAQTTQNIHNTQNIQILVNPFGNESTIPIPDSLYFEAIKNLVKGIPLLIKYVHYNPKYPENQNIKGKGLCSKYIEVHDGEDWKVDSKKNVIHNLITDKKDKLDDFVDEQIEKNKISKSLAYRYEKQTEKLDEVLNEDFRKEKASDESINLFKELEEEVNMTIENEKNKAKKKKKLE